MKVRMKTSVVEQINVNVTEFDLTFESRLKLTHAEIDIHAAANRNCVS